MAQVIVVGGGASGLIAAIAARRNKHDVTILERNPLCGRKLLVTGNGRCNYWNENQSITNYNSSSGNVKEIINEVNLEKTSHLLRTLGFIPKIRNNNYYPFSNQATTVRERLVSEALRLGVKIELNSYVEDIKKEDNHFFLTCKDKEYLCDKVVISTGGAAAYKTGSDGNFYKHLEQLGHTIITPLPSLVGLVLKDNPLKEASGVRSDVEISLAIDNNLIKTETGELQITDYGISGICTMQLSTYTSRSIKENRKCEVVINFVPGLVRNKKELIEFFDEQVELTSIKKVKELLDLILNYKVTNLILKKNKLDDKDQWTYLTDNQKASLVKDIISTRIEVKETLSFDKAQVTTGGVSLKDINTKTLESKIVEGLYLTGELLDVDGLCGGYNLTFAFVSGLVVGDAISD